MTQRLFIRFAYTYSDKLHLPQYSKNLPDQAVIDINSVIEFKKQVGCLFKELQKLNNESKDPILLSVHLLCYKDSANPENSFGFAPSAKLSGVTFKNVEEVLQVTEELIAGLLGTVAPIFTAGQAYVESLHLDFSDEC